MVCYDEVEQAFQKIISIFKKSLVSSFSFHLLQLPTHHNNNPPPNIPKHKHEVLRFISKGFFIAKNYPHTVHLCFYIAFRYTKDMEEFTMQELEQKIEKLQHSIDKLNRIFFWTLVVTIVLFVLPLLGLIFVVPQFIANYSSALNF
jgi:hypothetical protein